MQNFDIERTSDQTNVLKENGFQLSQNAWRDLETTNMKSDTKMPEEFGNFSFTNDDVLAKRPGGPIDQDDMNPDKDLRSQTQLAASDPKDLVDFANGNDAGKQYS